jgi:hypothetical protein
MEIREAVGFSRPKEVERPHPRKGEDRLSDRNVGAPDSPDTRKTRKPPAKASARTRNRGQRTGDIGRALRSVYDETLREDIPDDFLNLLGKLS